MPNLQDELTKALGTAGIFPVAAVFEDDVPPAGTACVECKAQGHWCPAKRYRGRDDDTGVCMACAEGRECSVVEARNRRIAKDAAEIMEPDRLDTPVAPARSIPFDPTVRIADDAPVEARRNWNGREIGLPAVDIHELKRCKVEAQKPDRSPAPETVDKPLAVLARRLGFSDQLVSYHRKKIKERAGLFRQEQDKPVERLALATLPDAEEVAAIPAQAEEPLPDEIGKQEPKSAEPENQETVTVQVTFTKAGVDAWWAQLSLREKAQIVTGNTMF